MTVAMPNSGSTSRLTKKNLKQKDREDAQTPIRVSNANKRPQFQTPPPIWVWSSPSSPSADRLKSPEGTLAEEPSENWQTILQQHVQEELSQPASQKLQDDEGSTEDSLATLPLINSRIMQLAPDIYEKVLVPCKAASVAVPSTARRTNKKRGHRHDGDAGN